MVLLDVENLLLAMEAIKLKPVNTNAHDFAKKDEQDRDDDDYDSKPTHIRQGAQDDDDSDLDIWLYIHVYHFMMKYW